MKKFIIDQEVWNLFPNMHIGVLVFKNPKKELIKEGLTTQLALPVYTKEN